MRSAFIAAILLSAAWPCFAGLEGFDQYKIIIDRKPFGELPAPVVRNPNGDQPPPDSFTKYTRVTSIVKDEEDGTIKVGFVYTKDPANPKSYRLRKGTQEDGFTVQEANFEDETADIESGGEVGHFKLGAGPAAMQAGVVSAPPPSLPTPAFTPPSNTDRPPSYIERRRMREQIQPPMPPSPSRFKTNEELDKHLHNYNMEIIRQHAKGDATAPPPLPIQLTPEEDSQLVREGVLAPAQ